jgi:hypothetical protein
MITRFEKNNKVSYIHRLYGFFDRFIESVLITKFKEFYVGYNSFLSPNGSRIVVLLPIFFLFTLSCNPPL